MWVGEGELLFLLNNTFPSPSSITLGGGVLWGPQLYARDTDDRYPSSRPAPHDSRECILPAV